MWTVPPAQSSINMTWVAHVASVVLSCVALRAGSPTPNSPETVSRVSLYVFANGSSAPRFANGSAAMETTLANGSTALVLQTVAGRVAQGVLIPAGARVAIGCPCNVPTVGSLSLWVRWSAAVQHARSEGSAAKVTLIYRALATSTSRVQGILYRIS